MIIPEMIAAIGAAARSTALDLKEAATEAVNYQNIVAGISGGGQSTGGMGSTSGSSGSGGGMTPAKLAAALGAVAGRTK